jgi:actin-like ATPase involved in cell morphogenesis
MGSTIAIDFGTTNTVIAEWVEVSRSPQTIVLKGLSYRLQDGPPAVPSLVYVDDAEAEAYRVGNAVLSQGLDDLPEAIERLCTSMKRDLLGDRPTPGAQSSQRLISSERAAEIFLDSVIQATLATGRSVSNLVLTTPVMAFESYLRWLARAAQNLCVAEDAPIRIIDEPTAAAFGYEIDDPGGYVLVIDFGGGTLDLSIVRLPEDTDAAKRGIVISPGMDPDIATASQRGQMRARVVAKTSCDLGGDAIDEALVDWLLDRRDLSRSGVTDDLLRLRTVAEDVKKTLSTETEVVTGCYLLRTLKQTLTWTVTRKEFEQEVLSTPALDALGTLRRKIGQVLKKAEEARGIGENDIGSVLLVGGTTLIPAVRQLVEERFGRDRVVQYRPFEAVAHGALRLVKSCPIDDILHHSYALEVKHIPPRDKSSQGARPQEQKVIVPSQSFSSTILEFLGLKTPRPALDPQRATDSQQPKALGRDNHPEPSTYDYLVLIQSGTLYPLENRQPLPNYLRPAEDGVSQIDFVIAEIEETNKPGPRHVLDSGGQLLAERGCSHLDRSQTVRLLSDKCSVTLDPPGKRSEEDRLEVSFTVDENRRLRLTVSDRVAKRCLLFDEPVTKLE